LNGLLQNVVSIFIFLTILIVSIFYFRIRTKKNSNGLFYISLTAKLISSIAFCLVYKFYYSEGDTFFYHIISKDVASVFWESPKEFFNLWILKTTNYWGLGVQNSIEWYLSSTSEKDLASSNMIFLTIPIQVLSLGNFYVTSLYIALLTFYGLWILYEIGIEYFTSQSKLLKCVLFVPSILYWTSGILKDAYVFLAVVYLVYAIFKLFHLFQFRIKYIMLVPLCITLIIMLKPYVVLVLLPSAFYWIMLELIKKFQTKRLKFLIRPYLILVSLLFVVITLFLIQGLLGKYGNYFEIFEFSKAVKEGFNLLAAGDQQSRYIINNSEYAYSGFNSFLSTLFRPLPWEAWNVTSIIASLENLFLLALSLIAIAKVILYPNRIINLLSKPFLTYCLLYSISFTIGLSMSVTNFGAIFRLKSAFLLFLILPILFLVKSSEVKSQ